MEKYIAWLRHLGDVESSCSDFGDCPFFCERCERDGAWCVAEMSGKLADLLDEN